uniref:Protein TAP1 n=1 Tax=Antirrhinum majus TaxID=4151 RepID=TAP1_ANTMA|nr:RecName: Full=Protein TAP1; Flags: Precursor [Antirrhinum majus]CAA40552.1 TAP1 [Antirrhinum majus]
MESKRVDVLVGLMLIMAIFGVHSVTAHLPPGICIDHCMKECKLSGIGVVACIKYCPVHCLPPDSSSKEHFCNLGCMLDKCAKFNDDEKKMSDCVFDCRKFHCKINTD